VPPWMQQAGAAQHNRGGIGGGCVLQVLGAGDSWAGGLLTQPPAGLGEGGQALVLHQGWARAEGCVACACDGGGGGVML